MSRITHRKGYTENLPQLAGAELGWALDERRLFIGNGKVEDGAPVLGNTEILTQYSNLLESASSYTYRGTEAGYVVNTGDENGDIVRNLQDKLDDTVSVRDFGALGDVNGADDTDAINRALYQLYCRDSSPTASRRTLLFPAGNYRVSDTIKIPPFAKIVGEGITSTIIKYIRPSQIDVVNIEIGIQYEIKVSADTDFVAIGAQNNNIGTIFIATGIGTGLGVVQVTPVTHVMETSDSNYETGSNFGTSATYPTGIEMSSLGIKSDSTNTLLYLNSIQDSSFSYIGLTGNLTESALSDEFNGFMVNNTSAIEINSVSSVSSIISRNLNFIGCVTSGTTYGLRVIKPCRGIKFVQGRFSSHITGVLIGDNVLNSPYHDYISGVDISRTIFDQIAGNGISIQNVKMNSSAFNVFYNVGNGLLPDGSGDLIPTVPVIDIYNSNNVSIGDLFQRTDVESATIPRIEFNDNGAIAFDSASALLLGSYRREVGLQSNIVAGSNDIEVFNIITNDSLAFRVDYTIQVGSAIRIGRIYTANNLAVATNTPYDDEYTESDAINATLSISSTAIVNSRTKTSLLVSLPGIVDAILNYSIVRLN